MSQLSENGDTFTNYLLITNVNTNDSGKYTCAPSNADPASIMVHVVNGKCFKLHAYHILINYSISYYFSISFFLLLLFSSYTGENPEAYSSSSQLSSCYAPYTIITLSLLLHLFYNYTIVLSRNSTKLDNCYGNNVKSHMNLKGNRNR